MNYIECDMHELETLAEWRKRVDEPLACARANARSRRNKILKRMALTIVGAGIAFWPLALYADATYARDVSLSDAIAAPTFLRLVPAHDARIATCTGLTDVSAYTWKGGALHSNGLHKWGRVTFDGRVWRNHSDHPILAGGWCS